MNQFGRFGRVGRFGAGPSANMPAPLGSPYAPTLPGSGMPGVPAGMSASALPPNPQVPLQGILDPQLDGADYFFYQTLVQGLASTAPNGTSQIQIDAGTDFLWIATTYQADIAGAAQNVDTIPVPLVTVLITDTGATKNLSNAPTPLGAMAGNGMFPYRLIQPRLFRASSVINFTWTSYVAAGTTYSNIYLIFHGIRMIAGTFALT